MSMFYVWQINKENLISVLHLTSTQLLNESFQSDNFFQSFLSSTLKMKWKIKNLKIILTILLTNESSKEQITIAECTLKFKPSNQLD